MKISTLPADKRIAGQKRKKIESQIGISSPTAAIPENMQGLSMKKISTKKPRVTVAKMSASAEIVKSSRSTIERTASIATNEVSKSATVQRAPLSAIIPEVSESTPTTEVDRQQLLFWLR